MSLLLPSTWPWLQVAKKTSNPSCHGKALFWLYRSQKSLRLRLKPSLLKSRFFTCNVCRYEDYQSFLANPVLDNPAKERFFWLRTYELVNITDLRTFVGIVFGVNLGDLEADELLQLISIGYPRFLEGACKNWEVFLREK